MAPAFVYFLGAKSVIHSSGGLGGSVFDVTPILSLLRITNTEAIIREEDKRDQYGLQFFWKIAML